MSTRVTVRLAVRTGLIPTASAQQGTHKLMAAYTDLGRAKFGFTERPVGDGAGGNGGAGGLVFGSHVRACRTWPSDRPWWNSAEVLFSSSLNNFEQVGPQLARHPRCAVYASLYRTGRIVLAVRVGRRPVLVGAQIEGRAGIALCAAAASAMHAWVTAGLEPGMLRTLMAHDGSAVKFSPGVWTC